MYNPVLISIEFSRISYCMGVGLLRMGYFFQKRKKEGDCNKIQVGGGLENDEKVGIFPQIIIFIK